MLMEDVIAKMKVAYTLKSKEISMTLPDDSYYEQVVKYVKVSTILFALSEFKKYWRCPEYPSLSFYLQCARIYGKMNKK